LNQQRLVFIEETGAKTHMVRGCGRAPRGQRLAAAGPHGHGTTAACVAALRHAAIAAPWVFDGPRDGASFLTYVERFLAPALRQGDIVGMDNLAGPKAAGVKQAIEQAGATLRYLPAYTPASIPSNQLSPSSKQPSQGCRTNI
jgi:DDE superfamily endonuclease